MPDLFSESPRSHSHGPSILTVIVLLCGSAWFLQSVIGAPLPKDELPAGALSLYVLREGQWWTSLTYMLTHKDFFHLGTNMLILILAGRKVLSIVGPQHFAYIFLIGGWMGAAISLVVRPESALIGASGAVFGVVGAYCALDPWANILAGFPRWVRIHVRARYVFLGLLISFVIFEIASHVLPLAMHSETLQGTAHLVHVGGIIAGYFYGNQLAQMVPATSAWDTIRERWLSRRRAHRGDYRQETSTVSRSGLEPAHRGSPMADYEDSPANASLSDEQFLQYRVDPILDKWHATGAESLTTEERCVLDEAARRIAEKNQ